MSGSCSPVSGSSGSGLCVPQRESSLVVPAHYQRLTLHLQLHVEEHAPRAGDPHYHLFEAAKAKLKASGLWKCVIGDELCDGQMELHHSYIEFSQIGDADRNKVERWLGLHFSDDEAFAQWAESPGNLEVLCAAHHRLAYGIHVLPGPLWDAVRVHRSGTTAPAQFVPASASAAGLASPASPSPAAPRSAPGP